MSLFDKMKKHQSPEKPNDGEFKSDVNTRYKRSEQKRNVRA